jgi:hypothetical protein
MVSLLSFQHASYTDAASVTNCLLLRVVDLPGTAVGGEAWLSTSQQWLIGAMLLEAQRGGACTFVCFLRNLLCIQMLTSYFWNFAMVRFGWHDSCQ